MKCRPFLAVAEKIGKSNSLLLPSILSNPDILSKLEVPSASAILIAASGFSQITRTYCGLAILLKLKPICRFYNITDTFEHKRIAIELDEFDIASNVRDEKDSQDRTDHK